MSKTVVTMKDIAAKCGVSLATVNHCMTDKGSAKYKQSTVAKIRQTAAELGYDRRMARGYRDRSNTPANPIFKVKNVETSAMLALRAQGHSNAEIAHRCGVSIRTVRARIGNQPDAITAANRKLAGKVKAAKSRIKHDFVAKKTVEDYNQKVIALNAKMLEVKQLTCDLRSMRKQAESASKQIGAQLVRLMPPGKAS